VNLKTLAALMKAFSWEWPQKERKQVKLDYSKGFNITDPAKPYTIQFTVDKAAKTIAISGGN